MAAGTILTELHGRELGLDGQGNLVLATSGIAPETNTQNGGSPGLVGKGILASVAISNGVGASSNICNVTFQLQDVFGNAISRITDFDVYLSDAATGIGLTGTTASGGIAAASSGGTVLGALTTSKAIRAQTNASGAFVLAITDTAKTAFYPVAAFGDRAITVGAQLTTASYHA